MLDFAQASISGFIDLVIVTSAMHNPKNGSNGQERQEDVQPHVVGEGVQEQRQSGFSLRLLVQKAVGFPRNGVAEIHGLWPLFRDEDDTAGHLGLAGGHHVDNSVIVLLGGYYDLVGEVQMEF